MVGPVVMALALEREEEEALAPPVDQLGVVVLLPDVEEEEVFCLQVEMGAHSQLIEEEVVVVAATQEPALAVPTR
jgi:hypothetical protein